MSKDFSWSKKEGRLQTPWYKKVPKDCPLPEYPRPQFTRETWINLNGLWDYAITDQNESFLSNFEDKILVPFPIESSLSGVECQLYPRERLWYHRTFNIPDDWQDKRVLLHFGAVDWKCKIWINKELIGEHAGGYYPFSFDITEHIDFDQENVILIRVYDPSEKGKQPSGKQWIKPSIVFYTTNSGIWQTVWLESVPKNYISNIKIAPDIDNNNLIFTSFVTTEQGKKREDFTINVKVLDENRIIQDVVCKPNQEKKIHIPKVKLWSPENPFLYQLDIKLIQGAIVIDEVGSYFAMRKFSIEEDEKGYQRFYLNNEPYFMTGLLDQGYWPDGLYTAPTDEALLFDIELTKEFGFNTIRKHLKVEPARWYYHCDRLGVLVWQDMINGGGKTGIIPQFFAYILRLKLKDYRCYWKAGMRKKSTREIFEKELKEMIDALYNVPSICIWVPFNEAWGQFDSKRISDWLMQYDSSRLVDHASGWFDHGGGHFISKHDYADKFTMPKKRGDRAVVLSETGGYTMMIPEHSWNPKKKYGYKNFNSKKELEDAYKNLIKDILIPAKKDGLCGAIYTQISDVEIEYNGIVTYDRKRKKMNPKKISKLNQQLT